MRPAESPSPSDRSAAAREASTALARWGEERSWSGTDPYDGLNATRASGRFRRSVLGERVLTHLVKRSPLDPANGDLAWRVFAYTQRELRRRGGGYRFQRRRFWANSAPHVRWVAAPLLLAFANLGAAAG